MSNAEKLFENAPSRRRALAEAGLVLATVFLPGTLVLLGVLPRFVAICLLSAWGLLLLRPWEEWRSGQRLRAAGCVLLFGLSLGASLAVSWFGGEGLVPRGRLGVQFTSVSLEGEGQAARKVVELTRVTPKSPAEGLLEVGDRILTVNGQPLGSPDPTEEFNKSIRKAGGGKSTEIRFTVQRKGETREVTVPVGPALSTSPLREPRTILWMCLRAIGVCLLVGLLLWRDGQGPAQIGLVREGWGRELLIGFPVLLGVYAGAVVTAIPLALLGKLLNLTEESVSARKELASGFVELGLSVPVFAAAMVIVASFEEVAFRGFLLPRMKVVLGRWSAAVLVSAVLFGVGHFYEGTLAVVQISMLGAYFGFVFVRRCRLPSVMLAHAALNTITFTLLMWLQRSGALEKLSGQAPP